MLPLSAHRDLLAWQRSMTLARNVYTATASSFGEGSNDLALQIRRSAVAVATAIAEGAARARAAEFRQLLGVAHAKLSELETQVMIATDLRILSGNMPLDHDIDELRQLLSALIRKLSERQALPPAESFRPAPVRSGV
jgi:four helix bundle protein